MEPNTQPTLCAVCHQPLLSTYYFCPNCGASAHPTPLDTSIAAQIKLYLYSIVLPFIAFISVGKWQGIKYYKSEDQKAHEMGIVAWVLILLSTLVLIWVSIIGTQAMIKASVDSINADFGSL